MTISFTRDGKTVQLDDLLAFLSEKVAANEPLKEANHHIAAVPGSKYIKLNHMRFGKVDSVYCFLDKDGNIYKAATYKAPAKGIRGTVFEENYSWNRGLGLYGAAYLK